MISLLLYDNSTGTSRGFSPGGVSDHTGQITSGDSLDHKNCFMGLEALRPASGTTPCEDLEEKPPKGDIWSVFWGHSKRGGGP